MKTRLTTFITLLACNIVFAEDICHFNKVEIPRNESRLLELASVIEFRCEPTIPKALIDEAHGNTQFLAERYQDGKCVSREFFSVGKGSSTEKHVISFGWNMDNQKLVGVNDTGFFRLPGFANLPNFHSSRPRLWSFFKDSKPVPRESKDGLKFNLYPIIGIRGSKAKSSIDANGYPPASTFQPIFRSTPLSSTELINTFRKQPDSIIVYLYLYGATPGEYAKHISEKNGTDNPTKMQNKSQ